MSGALTDIHFGYDATGLLISTNTNQFHLEETK